MPKPGSSFWSPGGWWPLPGSVPSNTTALALIFLRNQISENTINSQIFIGKFIRNKYHIYCKILNVRKNLGFDPKITKECLKYS